MHPGTSIRHWRRLPASSGCSRIRCLFVRIWRITRAAAGLDPFLVAALIRQESEFDAQIVSHAGAYGLTQVLPSTGRELSRRLGIRGFPNQYADRSRHQSPPRNGISAAVTQPNWTDSGSWRWPPTTPAKAVPLPGRREVSSASPPSTLNRFHSRETRNYVKIVLRNADLYRRLYSEKLTVSLRFGHRNLFPPSCVMRSLVRGLAVLPNFLLPETVVQKNGTGPVMELGPYSGRQLLLTLGITRIIEQESLDVEIYGSADNVTWSDKPLLRIPQKFYCGTYSMFLNLAGHPDIHYLRTSYKLNRWGRGDSVPLFSFYLFAQDAAVAPEVRTAVA